MYFLVRKEVIGKANTKMFVHKGGEKAATCREELSLFW